MFFECFTPFTGDFTGELHIEDLFTGDSLFCYIIELFLFYAKFKMIV